MCLNQCPVLVDRYNLAFTYQRAIGGKGIAGSDTPGHWKHFYGEASITPLAAKNADHLKNLFH